MATNSVLIVDDDPDLCHLLGGILRNRNLQVGIASNLNAAEACISEIKPFIIFLDHNLPDGAGIDFIAKIAEIRSEEHTSELQSRENLVCRLLLEKKKKHQTTQPR